MFFPAIIYINKEFMMVGHPTQIPSGASFQVIQTNATYRDKEIIDHVKEILDNESKQKA